MRRTVPAALGFACVAALAGAHPAAASVYCVPDTSVAADCSFAAASPQAAVDAAVSNAGVDTVRIGAGTFGGIAKLSDGGAGTTIIGAGRTQTTLSGSGSGPVVQLAGDFSVEGLKIRRPSGDGLVVDATRAVFDGVDIARDGNANAPVVQYPSGPPDGTPAMHDVTISAPVASPGWYALTGGSATLENVRIDAGNTGYAVFGGAWTILHSRIKTDASIAALYLYGSALVADTSVTTTAPGADGIYAISSGADVSVRVRDSTLVSTAASPTGAAIVGANFLPGTNVGVSVAGVAAAGFPRAVCGGTGSNATSVVNVTVTYTAAVSPNPVLCQGGSYSNAGVTHVNAGLGLITAAPAFLNLAGGDITPAPGGNLVDAGDPGFLEMDVPSTDLNGAERVTDGNGDGAARRDIGAVERPTAPLITPMPGPSPAPVVIPTPAPNPGGIAPGSTPAPTAAPAPTPLPLRLTAVGFFGRLATPRSRKAAPFLALTKMPARETVPVIKVVMTHPAAFKLSMARRLSGRPAKFRKLKGTVVIKRGKRATVWLRPTGTWMGRPLAKGVYRIIVAVPGAAAPNRRSLLVRVR